ncbi:hypothetical protein [Mycolicibacterium diernhoferi]|uniref:Uncharacterized protein n=1 Tax=Mycolicibacterium diernhoferi TaxID=1801 RepID=A0A1Q4H6C0_9MYCO|nr:hypothetical protein [Mycolicibacterium diernhoferi]OJZ63003.1 hypothetical protein BRW64_24085 [Mycolicibacterium diernhoferi]OPE54055.1 hypothetical protein BV510_12320 [Mycolicibacterium diernhoferi]PEG53080.1 hypothetical protein CRI78_17990 [Mycolicibacterium diernhoferi]QYL22051.1 hypothetical protein K0O62_24300 [Mycolicibacterium diernhoferi]
MTARPDGATEWISPTGHTYVATPGVAILFPHWNITRLFRHRDPSASSSAAFEISRCPPASAPALKNASNASMPNANTERVRNATGIALDGDPPY